MLPTMLLLLMVSVTPLAKTPPPAALVLLPLMTLLEPASALKVLQSSVISFELCRLKAPLQSERDGSVTLRHRQTCIKSKTEVLLTL